MFQAAFLGFNMFPSLNLSNTQDEASGLLRVKVREKDGKEGYVTLESINGAPVTGQVPGEPVMVGQLMDDLWVMGMAYSMNLYEWIQFIDIHWYLLYIYRHYRIIMNCKDVVFTIPLLTLFFGVSWGIQSWPVMASSGNAGTTFIKTILPHQVWR